MPNMAGEIREVISSITLRAAGQPSTTVVQVTQAACRLSAKITKNINCLEEVQYKELVTAVPKLEDILQNLSRSLDKFLEVISLQSAELALSKAEDSTRHGLCTILEACRATLESSNTTIGSLPTFGLESYDTEQPSQSRKDSFISNYSAPRISTSDLSDLREVLPLHIITVNMLTLIFETSALDQHETTIAPVADKLTNLPPSSDSTFRSSLAEIRGLARAAGADVLSPSTSTPSSPTSSYFGSSLSAATTQLTLASTGTVESTASVGATEDGNGYLNQAHVPLAKPSRRTHLHLPSFHFPRRFDSFVSRSVPGSPSSELPPKLQHESRLQDTSTSTSNKHNHGLASSMTFPSTKRSTNHHHRSISDEFLLVPMYDFHHRRPKAVDPTAKRRIPASSSQTIGCKHSRTPSSQVKQQEFERYLFRNAAILCDVPGTAVEYTLTGKNETNPYNFEIETAMKTCRICLVRHKIMTRTGQPRYETSIWSFSDDFSVRLEQKLNECEEIIPYISYLQPNKASINLTTKLVYHGPALGDAPLRTITTNWLNYYFEDEIGCREFQNQLFDRRLLATLKTERTIRVHEGLANIVSHHEHICATEIVRVWDEEDTGGILALIHFSVTYKKGYLRFYLNNKKWPIFIRDEGGRAIRIKGLRIPADAGYRSHYRAQHAKNLDKGAAKVISAKMEFCTEHDKMSFLELFRNAQKNMVDIPDALCS